MHGAVENLKVEEPDWLAASMDMSVDDEGRSMYRFISELYPICRSITGDGVRKTLNRILEHIPLTICEVPSGLQVFDWTVPLEWNIRDAYIKNSAGERIVDFRASNLHVLGYSVPVHMRIGLSELREHLLSDPQHPDWIPYRTSYYKPAWGILSAASAAAGFAGRRVRGLYRLNARTRSSDLWRTCAAWSIVG
ncbi:DUF2172 domain-containing protein [Bradyrhizobium sp. TZ2]